MDFCCDLEVDVNGEEIFFVNKKIISTYSGKLRRLFGKSTYSNGSLKVIFSDFPGGPKTFELISKFCYNNGKIEITTSNFIFLHCGSKFMEMEKSVSKSQNLLEQTEKTMDEILYWSFLEILNSLKQYQCLNFGSFDNSFELLDKLLDSLIGKLGLSLEASPCPSTTTSSGTSSRHRFSFDSKSTESVNTGFTTRVSTWWFEDLMILSPVMVRRLVKLMISHKLESLTTLKFLFYYLKSSSCTSAYEKREVLETLVTLVSLLGHNTVSCKRLFAILRVGLGLKLDRTTKTKLEHMIGLKIDQATLDDLLVPGPYRSSHLYDVDLVIRLMKIFVSEFVSVSRLKKVGNLMDLYLTEVAPDPGLKASKFIGLVMILPDSARGSHDKLYRAVDMYLEAHTGISIEDKTKICSVINHKKLNSDNFINLSHNSRFPSRLALQALIYQQSKLKSLIQTADESVCDLSQIRINEREHDNSRQLVLFSKKLDEEVEDESYMSQLQGMQFRVTELDKACRKMQSEMGKIMKSRSTSNGRFLPRLCS